MGAIADFKKSMEAARPVCKRCSKKATREFVFNLQPSIFVCQNHLYQVWDELNEDRISYLDVKYCDTGRGIR